LADVFPDTRRYEGCRGITAYTRADDSYFDEIDAYDATQAP
jgi:hypothetical protein